VRHASLLAVKTRMRSVENIKKITSAMKMVAASKMRSARERMETSRGMVGPLVRFLGDMPGHHCHIFLENVIYFLQPSKPRRI